VTTIEVFRLCPECRCVFRGEEAVSVDEADAPVRCPTCGTPGRRLIAVG